MAVYVPPKEAAASTATQLAIAAAADAVSDTGESEPTRAAARDGGRCRRPRDHEAQRADGIEKGAMRVSPFFVPMMMPNATAGNIAMNFGSTGPDLCIATACAAGTNPIGKGARLIRDGARSLSSQAAPKPASRRSRSPPSRAWER